MAVGISDAPAPRIWPPWPSLSPFFIPCIRSVLPPLPYTCPPPDLKVLGGLQPLFALLQGGEAPSLQAGAAYVLGTAASNNEKLAETMISTHPELLPTLLKVKRGWCVTAFSDTADASGQRMSEQSIAAQL